MFKRRNRADSPNPATTEPHIGAGNAISYDPETFDVAQMRDLLFERLHQRVGPEMAQAMREDFDHHLTESDGLDKAYICLSGKLINAVDRINEMLDAAEGRHGTPIHPAPSVADFNFFQK